MNSQIKKFELLERARAAMEEALRSRSTLDEMAKRSYSHANGFQKILLTRQAEGGWLRLHFWPHGQSADDVHWHNHPWRFESLIINGVMAEATLTKWLHTTAPNSYEKFAVVISSYGVRTFKLKRKVKIIDYVHCAYSRASLYECDLTRIHRAYALTPHTITLIEQGPFERSRSVVFCRPDHPPIVNPARRLSCEVVEKNLRSAIFWMEACV